MLRKRVSRASADRADRNSVQLRISSLGTETAAAAAAELGRFDENPEDV